MKAPGDSLVILDAFQNLLLVLLSHTGKGAQLAFARQLRDSIDITDLKSIPNERDGLRSESLNLQQLQHARTELRQQLAMQAQLAFAGDLAQVGGHAFADARNLQQLLLVGDDLADLLRQRLDGFGGATIRAYAEGVVAADLHQVSSLVKRICDGFIVQAGSVQFYLAQPLHARHLDNTDPLAVFEGDVQRLPVWRQDERRRRMMLARQQSRLIGDPAGLEIGFRDVERSRGQSSSGIAGGDHASRPRRRIRDDIDGLDRAPGDSSNGALIRRCYEYGSSAGVHRYTCRGSRNQQATYNAPRRWIVD